MSTLSEALTYAARGWKVIPVHSVTDEGYCSCGQVFDYQAGPTKHATGKHPHTEHGHKDASSDPSQIYLWWHLWPEPNVAIATGYRSNVIVLDIDAKNGGPQSLALLQRRQGVLPKTMRVNSGGGGFHLYFQYPGFEVRGRRDMRPGIDVMADGGRIVAPPSRHKSGKRYEWAMGLGPDDVVLAELPKWLLRMIQTRNPPKKRIKIGAWC